MLPPELHADFAKWERAYLVGLGVGCAFGVGVVLSLKNSLPGFLLAAGGGFTIWAFGRSPTVKGRARPSEQNGTAFGEKVTADSTD
jgi:hypothetical protein